MKTDHLMWTKRDYYLQQLRALPLVIVFLAVGLGMWRVHSITAGAMAAVLFALALLMFIGDRLLARSGRRVQGVVADHQAVEESFVPVIEFHDNAGNLRREATGSGLGGRKPPVGSRVIVLYDPAGKRACELDRFWWRHACTLTTLLLGVIFALGAVFGK